MVTECLWIKIDALLNRQEYFTRGLGESCNVKRERNFYISSCLGYIDLKRNIRYPSISNGNLSLSRQ